MFDSWCDFMTVRITGSSATVTSFPPSFTVVTFLLFLLIVTEAESVLANDRLYPDNCFSCELTTITRIELIDIEMHATMYRIRI